MFENTFKIIKLPQDINDIKWTDTNKWVKKEIKKAKKRDRIRWRSKAQYIPEIRQYRFKCKGCKHKTSCNQTGKCKKYYRRKARLCIDEIAGIFTPKLKGNKCPMQCLCCIWK